MVDCKPIPNQFEIKLAQDYDILYLSPFIRWIYEIKYFIFIIYKY